MNDIFKFVFTSLINVNTDSINVNIDLINVNTDLINIANKLIVMNKINYSQSLIKMYKL